MTTNTTWSTYLQRINTLYLSRQLRFDDRFKQHYTPYLGLCNAKTILELGCGPGAMAMALARWYPSAHITATDRDSAFISFARKEAASTGYGDIVFEEADITALHYTDDSFDATISHTVQEHVEHGAFFGQQYRVLKPGGVCVVFSAGRRSINHIADTVSAFSDFEKEIHTKTGKYYKEADEKHAVGKYAVTEVELPGLMEAHGFKNIETHYTAVNLTPDSEQYEKNFALRMIEANRQMELDGVKYINAIAPNVCSDDEINLWNKEINKRYDTRIKQYNLGLKQWDVSLSLTMIVKGTK